MKRLFPMSPVLGLGLVVLQISSQVYGWGAYGHEAINFEALGKIKQTEIGKCLLKSRLKAGTPNAKEIEGGAFVLGAVAPDYFWKTVGLAPKDNDLVEQRKTNNRTEHSYHFFEGNAFAKLGPMNSFIPGSIASLPSGPKLMTLMPDYQKLLSVNADFVKEVDPSKAIKDPLKPSAREVADHGTAPWRAQQMYQLAVASLKEGNVDLALVYLAALGHYVGDMSQPFHANLDYDGAYPADFAPGIHSLFETEMLNLYAGVQAEDKKLTLWANYDATHAGVSAAAGNDVKPIAENQIVPELLAVIDSGFPYGDSLMNALHAIREKHPELKKPARPAATDPVDPHHNHSAPQVKYSPAIVKEFMNTKVNELNDQGKATGNQITVVQVAEKRMAASTRLLARLLTGAYAQAQKETEGGLNLNCDSVVKLDRDAVERLAILNYKAADYLTKEAQPLPPKF